MAERLFFSETVRRSKGKNDSDDAGDGLDKLSERDGTDEPPFLSRTKSCPSLPSLLVTSFSFASLLFLYLGIPPFRFTDYCLHPRQWVFCCPLLLSETPTTPYGHLDNLPFLLGSIPN